MSVRQIGRLITLKEYLLEILSSWFQLFSPEAKKWWDSHSLSRQRRLYKYPSMILLEEKWLSVIATRMTRFISPKGLTQRSSIFLATSMETKLSSRSLCQIAYMTLICLMHLSLDFFFLLIPRRVLKTYNLLTSYSSCSDHRGRSEASCPWARRHQSQSPSHPW